MRHIVIEFSKNGLIFKSVTEENVIKIPLEQAIYLSENDIILRRICFSLQVDIKDMVKTLKKFNKFIKLKSLDAKPLRTIEKTQGLKNGC